MDADQELLNYFIHKQQFIKNVLLKPLKDSLPIDEADTLDKAKWILVTHICLELKMSADVVLSFIDEHLNLRDLL